VRAEWLVVIPGTRRLTPKSLMVVTDDKGHFRFEEPAARFGVSLRAEGSDDSGLAQV
jgi:hypothetical protein